MIEQNPRDKGTLLLAFITGLAINGSFSVLFSTFVPFSIFPLIALGLAAWCLHQRYLNRNMPDGMPSLAAAFFCWGFWCTARWCVPNIRISGLTSSRPF